VRDLLWRCALRVAHRILLCWWFLTRPTLHGAFVALWVGDRLLVVRNSYRSDVSIPSGGIGRGESPKEAAARELFEEVGLRIAPCDLRFAGEWTLPYEWKQDRAHFFELHLEATPNLELDNREVIAADFLPIETVNSMPLVPHLRVYLAEIGALRQQTPGPG